MLGPGTKSEPAEAIKICAGSSHCSYLDTYISQKNKLCNNDFKGKFKASVQVSIKNIFI